MAANTTPIFPATIGSGCVKLGASDQDVPTLLYTAGTNGSRVTVINVTTNDNTQEPTVKLSIVKNSVTYYLSAYDIPGYAGFEENNPSINLLDHGNFNGTQDKSLMLASGEELYIETSSLMPDEYSFIYIHCQAGDY